MQADKEPKNLNKALYTATKQAMIKLVAENGEPLELKEVSRTAVDEATTALVLSTHTSPNGRVTTNDKSVANYSPFSIRPLRLGSDRLVLDPVRVNIQGSLPPNFFDWVTLHGIDLHPEAKQYASHTSGGHACLRTMVNLLAAGQFNEILSLCLKPASSEVDKKVVIYGVGDKYQKTTTILDGSLKFCPKVWYPIDN